MSLFLKEGQRNKGSEGKQEKFLKYNFVSKYWCKFTPT